MQQRDQLIKTVEIAESIVGLREDGIIYVYYKAHTEITVELQEKMLLIFNELTEGKKCFFIFQADDHCSVTKEARDNATAMEEDGRSPCSATAVVVQNIAYKLIADFYYKINKPKHPFKVVRCFEDAVTWLSSLPQTSAAS